MPVALKSTHDESQQRGVNDLLPNLSRAKPPAAPQLELDIFEQIKEYLNKIKTQEGSKSKDERRIDRASKNIGAAKEMISKAVEKCDLIQRKKDFLRDKLDKLEARKAEALKYWQDYGFDVRQTSKPDHDFELYEFIYTKLREQELVQPITIGVKLQDKKLQIVSRVPEEALSDVDIESLNDKLINYHHPKDKHVDFKLAMITIRKVLIKHPDV